jgi:hypothetical protein
MEIFNRLVIMDETWIHKYKAPFIISRTDAAIWAKTNFGPTGHRHPRSSPLPCVS